MMESIEIPGEATFWRSYAVPPGRVDLPLRVYAGAGYAVYVAVAGLVCALFAFMLLITVAATILSGLHGWRGALALGILAVTSGYALLTAGPLLAFRARDLFLRGPAVTVTDRGLRDARAGITIGWDEVAAARITANKHGISGIDLTLRSGLPPRPALFARGGFGPLLRPRDRVFHLDIQWLSVRPRTFAHAVTTLVGLHGGRVET